MFSAVAACTIFLAAYLVIALERPVSRMAAALTGGALVLALGISDAKAAFFSEHTGVDWNVVFLLLGMMVIVGVLRESGVFEYLAIWAAKRSKGRAFPLMVLLVLITAVASALLDNVTTVLLVGPVTILICQRLRLPAAPYLIAEVLASNIGGTATLVGDPPNIIVASRGGLTFNDFLVHLAPISLVLLAVLIGLCRWLFASAFRTDPDAIKEIMALREREAIRDRRLLVISLSVLAVVLAVFVLHPVLHYEPSVVALLGAGLLVAVARVGTRTALQDVEWETLAFFAGLFVMVGGLVRAGVLDALAAAITGFAGSNLLGFTMVLLGGSGVLSGVVDNIPYVASVSPVVAGLLDAGGEPRVLWWALLLGADLGGNATLIGASANIVMAGVAARSGIQIGFWRFTRYGLVVTGATLLVSAVYVWLRYFVVG
ncbi:SLC13 family permease [Pseudonocardia acaciae]|uniref:SLC13 family permease n=1 Tax=Pseudonocardia acaciae TaxID=551276 RepID=UPI00048F512B|nr:ArsB/NhaD family transporter [Pseudonocardia acaciae]